jgi:prepilin-type N-terminal cleavage/methylation domain-containing protein
MITPRKTYQNLKGFTLIEVLVAALILGIVSFALLALLRAGDQLALRARLNGVLASQVQARGALLTSLSYQDLSSIKGTWYRGSLGSTAQSPYLPTLLTLAGDGPNSTIPYLMYGKPLPGSSTPRPLSKYLETIDIQDGAPGELEITYSLAWESPLGVENTPDEDKRSQITVTFSKYDPSLY